MPAGQPTKYKIEYNEQARKHCLLGATDKQLSDLFNITEATLNNWKKNHPKFFESIKDGKERADQQVVESLFHRAKGYSHEEDKIFNNNGEPMVVKTMKHYPPDATSAIFWLKNRRKEEWRDQKEVSGNIKHDHTHKHEGLQEADSRIADLLGQGTTTTDKAPKPH